MVVFGLGLRVEDYSGAWFKASGLGIGFRMVDFEGF